MAKGIVTVALACWSLMAGAEVPEGGAPKATETGEAVSYEAFGAVGDGKADDLPAICAAHEHANKHGKRVKSKPGAVYHLGRRALTAVIATDTDWGTSRFTIDDSQEVENHRKHLFEIRSLLAPVEVKVERLARGQTRLEPCPPCDCVVYVQNRNRKIFIRKGLNQNDGTPQQEVFIFRRDGAIEGAITWDYDTVTQVTARPIDPVRLVVRGGVFTHVGNRMRQEKGYNYWGRNIKITRSNTEIAGLTHRVTGETEVGHPYGGFLAIQQCADITLRDCSIDSRKTYKTIGAAGKPVSMGSYGYSASLVVNFRMIKCTMDAINDRARWGVIGSNFMKNILLEDCVLSRMDVHQGVSGDYIIRRTTLGYAGLNAIGNGRLIVEDSTLHGSHLITFRSDYGSTWEGDVVIRNCRWIPQAGSIPAQPVMFGMQNDGTHDFGYPCSMPREIRIDGLHIEDAKPPANYQGVVIFGDPAGRSQAERPFPYAQTQTVRVRGLKTASGVAPRLSTNPEWARPIDFVSE